jgi:hypothetical protein
MSTAATPSGMAVMASGDGRNVRFLGGRRPSSGSGVVRASFCYNYLLPAGGIEKWSIAQ